MKACFLLCAFGLATFATAIPSDYEDDLLFRRAVNDKCKAPLGTGSCQRTANCPGISYPTGLCPKDPNDVQCCVKKTCKVPSKGSGYCRSVKNNGCSGGKFYSGYCPGDSDIRCCVKGGATPPASTTCKVPKAGSGNCRSVKNDGCPGGKFYTGYCPGNSDNKCCVKTGSSTCSVPKVGAGNCQSVKNDGCPGGTFYTGYCPGNSDNKCCVKKAAPPPASPCTAAALDKILFTDSISTFLAAKSARNPSCFDWNDDGCSCSPDQLGEFDFLPSCKRHDFGYRNSKKQGRFDALKARIDTNLKDDLYDVCSKFSGLQSYKGVECRRIADLYVAAVRKFGKKMKRDDGVSATNELQKRECDLADLFK